MLPHTLLSYETLGFKTIPITYGNKATPPKDWVTRTSDSMWSEVDGLANIALQAGPNQMFLIDPDTEHGSEIVRSHFQSLGIKTWRIKTWRGFEHHWVRTTIPSGLQYNGKLVDNAGDWRSDRGYGLAAPSIIRKDGQEYAYSIPADNPREVPYLSWQDIESLLVVTKSADIENQSIHLSVPVVHRSLPGWVYETMTVLSEQEEKGTVLVGGRTWASRSEAALSVMMSALLNGFPYQFVVERCQPYQSYGWWNATTKRAVTFIEREGDRKVLSDMYNSTYNIDKKDEDVLRALVSILWYTGYSSGGVSNRDIQLLVSRGRQSVSASVARLIRNDYISLVAESDGKRASTYSVNADAPRTQGRKASIVEDAHQEVCRHGGISASQKAVLDALTKPMTTADVVACTGLSSSGAYAALHKLYTKNLVEKSGKLWVPERLDADVLNTMFSARDHETMRQTRIAKERGKYHANRGAA